MTATVFTVDHACAGRATRFGAYAATRGADGLDAGPVPFALVADALHVYVRPTVNNVIVNGPAAPCADLDTPPFDELHTTRYDVIGEPPSLDGGVNDTENRPGAETTGVTAVGAPGTPPAATGALAAEVGPVPIALVADALHV